MGGSGVQHWPWHSLIFSRPLPPTSLVPSQVEGGWVWSLPILRKSPLRAEWRKGARRTRPSRGVILDLGCQGHFSFAGTHVPSLRRISSSWASGLSSGPSRGMLPAPRTEEVPRHASFSSAVSQEPTWTQHLVSQVPGQKGDLCPGPTPSLGWAPLQRLGHGGTSGTPLPLSWSQSLVIFISLCTHAFAERAGQGLGRRGAGRPPGAGSQAAFGPRVLLPPPSAVLVLLPPPPPPPGLLPLALSHPSTSSSSRGPGPPGGAGEGLQRGAAETGGGPGAGIRRCARSG